MANLTQYQKNINHATWIDINPEYPEAGSFMPERMSDIYSVSICSIPVLLACPVGDRGGIFEPEYGSDLSYFLQEPIDVTTAYKIRMSIVATINKWEPRVEVLLDELVVEPDIMLPGYRVSITMIYKDTGETDTQRFNLYAGS